MEIAALDRMGSLVVEHDVMEHIVLQERLTENSCTVKVPLFFGNQDKYYYILTIIRFKDYLIISML